jgi:hypothetical protein
MSWERVYKNYNKNHLFFCVYKLTRSLETKWGIIKYDVSKFIRNFEIIQAFQKLDANHKNILQKYLKLYKVKHLKKVKLYFHTLLVGFNRHLTLG